VGSEPAVVPAPGATGAAGRESRAAVRALARAAARARARAALRALARAAARAFARAAACARARRFPPPAVGLLCCPAFGVAGATLVALFLSWPGGACFTAVALFFCRPGGRA